MKKGGKYIIRVIILFCMVFVTHSLMAASYSSSGSGNWNSSSTWGGAGVPVAGDNVTIKSGHTVTLTAGAACAALVFEGNAGLTMGGYDLTMTGNFSVSGCNAPAISSSGGYLIFAGTSQTINVQDCGGNTDIPYMRLSNSTIETFNSGTTGKLRVTQRFDCRTGSSTFTNSTASYQTGSFVITGECTAPNCTFNVANANLTNAFDLSGSTSNPIQIGGVTLNVNSTITFGSVNVNTTNAFSGSYVGNITHSGTVTVVGNPTITISATTLSGFSYCAGAGPSTSQNYTVSGSYLTTDITITAPSNYEVSTDNSNFYGSRTLTPSSGTVNSTTIYVRLKSGKSAGSYNSELITHTSSGATEKDVTCSGTVNSVPSAAGTISGTATVTQGQTGVAYSVGAISGATGYTWSLPSNASIASGSNTNSITVNYASNAASGNITVYGTNSCGNGTVSANYAVKVSPGLTAAGGATVDGAFNVTFTNDDTWKNAITSITVGGTTLTGGYSISAGQITFTPSASNPSALLQSSGTKTIVVAATGYANTSVNQTIGVGAASKLGMSIQPTAPSSNGAALGTQPVVLIQDQYGNTTTSTATVVASATSSLWNIGGTTSKAGVSGTATFTDLTATNASSVTGATITFTSTGLSSVTSSSFDIPSPASVTIASASQIAAGNIQKNTAKQALSAFTMAVTTANAVVSQIVFSTAGTYAASDVSKFQLWYSTSSTLGSASQIGTDITTSLGTGSHTFGSLSRSISSGTTGYFWITVDVASGATTSNNINVASIANTDISFVNASKLGSVSASGTQTIVPQPVTYYTRQSGAWNDVNTWSTSCKGTPASSTPTSYDNVVLCDWDHTVTLAANTTVASVTMQNRCTINQGSYNLTITGNCDISYSSGQESKITVGDAALIIGGNLSIGPIQNGTQGLSWDNGTITVAGNFAYSHGWTATSFPGTKAGCFTVNGTSVNIGSNITIPYFKQGSSSFTKTGSATLTVSTTFDRNCVAAPTVSAGAFTVNGSTVNASCGTPSIALSSTNPAVAAANIAQGSTKNAIYKFTLAVTTNDATLNQLDFSTTNTAADVTKYQLWYKTSDDFANASQIGSDITTSLGTGSHSFTSLNRTISTGTTGYFWITTDVASGATTTNSISVSAITAANLTFASGNKSGTAYAGGAQTIVVAPTLTVSTATLTGFSYVNGSGPSQYQTFTVSGSNLINAPGNITVSAPTNYVVCNAAGGTYGTSTTVAYTSSTLSSTTVYVRLKSGLSSGNYNSETITFSGGGYSGATTVTCSGTVGKIYYLSSSGNWTNPSIWSSASCGGAAETTNYPGQSDSVVIGCSNVQYDGLTVTLTSNTSVGGVKLDRKQTINMNGYNLNIVRNFIIGLTDTYVEGGGLVVVGNGTLTVNGDLTLGFNNDTHGLQWNNGNVNVGGNLIIADGGGPASYGLDPGTNSSENTSIKPGGSSPTYAGSIIMTGTNKTIQVGSLSNYNSATFNGGVTGTLNYAVDLVNLKLASNTISKTGVGTLYISGVFDVNNQTAFANSAGSMIVTGTIVNASNATLTNDATLNINTNTNNMSSINGTTGSTTKYYTTGAEPVSAGTYYNLTIDGTGTKTLQGNITVNNILSFPSAGYLDLNAHNLIMNNWANGNITSLATDRYILLNNGTITANDVNSGETVNFPMGLSTSTTDFCRVDISNSDAAHTSFAITSVSNSSNNQGTNSGGNQHTVDWVKLTYNISSSSTNATVTLYWDASKELSGFDRTKSQINHHNGTTWEKKGIASAASVYSGSIYYASAATNSFSPYGVGDDGSLLPIELSSFKASKSGDKIKIKWTTASETNNDYFTLEKSYDGETWHILYTCDGAGTSTQEHNYSYTDDEPLGGFNYYRLKQTDIDGQFEYSKIESVEMKNDSLSVSIFPNPSVLEDLNLLIKGSCTEVVTVTINDMYGRQICEGNMEISRSPVQIKISDICTLNPGSYLVSIKGKNIIQNKRIVVK